MKLSEIMLKEEKTTEKTKEEWAEATDKRRDKLKKSGKYEGRYWVNPGSNTSLGTLKDRWKMDHVGEVIDKLVSKAMKGGD